MQDLLIKSKTYEVLQIETEIISDFLSTLNQISPLVICQLDWLICSVYIAITKSVTMSKLCRDPESTQSLIHKIVGPIFSLIPFLKKWGESGQIKRIAR